MPKTLIAKNIQPISSLHFKVDEGIVTGLTLDIEVNYGEMGCIHQLDIWNDLTDNQQAQFQSLYERLCHLAKKLILD